MKKTVYCVCEWVLTLLALALATPGLLALPSLLTTPCLLAPALSCLLALALAGATHRGFHHI